MKRPALLLFVASAAGVAVVATAGIATAGTATASPDAGGQPGHRPGHQRLLTPAQRLTLRETGHVEIVKHTRKHGDLTLEVQRGRITSLTDSAITVLSRGGYSHTYVLTSATSVHEGGQRESLSALSGDERVMVVAVHGSAGDVARRISCVRAPAAGTVAATAPTSS